VLGAVKTHLARRGVQRDHAHAFFEAIHAGAHFLDYACQFVAEQRRRHNHAGVIATLVHLEIGAAGKSNLHLDQNFAIPDAGNGHSFYLQIFFAVQDGGCHLSVHCLLPSQAFRSQVLPG
jgi:hypothetical protein